MIPREIAESFVKEIEQSFAVAEGTDLYAFCEHAFRVIRKTEKLFEAMRSRETFIEFVISLPGEEGAKLPEWLHLAKFAPTILEKDFMRIIHDIAKSNPAKTGRPPRIKSKEGKDRIVAEIWQVQMKIRCTRGKAQEIVAHRNQLSLHTVQKIWRDRENRDIDESSSIPELASAMRELMEKTASPPEDSSEESGGL
jgi:hypothetical protein